MITSREDYKYVTFGDDSADLIIDGDIMPARDVAGISSGLRASKTLRAVDVAFLMEALCERMAWRNDDYLGWLGCDTIGNAVLYNRLARRRLGVSGLLNCLRDICRYAYDTIPLGPSTKLEKETITRYDVFGVPGITSAASALDPIDRYYAHTGHMRLDPTFIRAMFYDVSRINAVLMESGEFDFNYILGDPIRVSSDGHFVNYGTRNYLYQWYSTSGDEYWERISRPSCGIEIRKESETYCIDHTTENIRVAASFGWEVYREDGGECIRHEQSDLCKIVPCSYDPETRTWTVSSSVIMQIVEEIKADKGMNEETHSSSTDCYDFYGILEPEIFGIVYKTDHTDFSNLGWTWTPPADES